MHTDNMIAIRVRTDSTKDGHPFHYPFFKTAPFEEVLSVKVNISNEIKLEDWGGIEILYTYSPKIARYKWYMSKASEQTDSIKDSLLAHYPAVHPMLLINP